MKIKDVQKTIDQSIFKDIMMGELGRRTMQKLMKDAYEIHIKETLKTKGGSYYEYLHDLQIIMDNFFQNSNPTYKFGFSGHSAMIQHNNLLTIVDLTVSNPSFFILNVRTTEEKSQKKKWNFNVRISYETGFTIL